MYIQNRGKEKACPTKRDRQSADPQLKDLKFIDKGITEQ